MPGTHQNVVLFKTPTEPVWLSQPAGKSITSSELGCSLQDRRPPDRKGKLLPLFALGPKLGCSLQDSAGDVGGRAAAAAGDFAPLAVSESASSSSGNRDGLDATSGGYREPPGRIRDHFRACGSDTQSGACADSLVGCKRSDQAGTWMGEKTAGKNGSGAATSGDSSEVETNLRRVECAARFRN